MCPGVGLEAWLRWSARPFGGVECRGHAQCPAFAPDPLLLCSWLFRSGSWIFFFLVFSIFLSIICPNCTCMQLFLVPYNFFVFCCSRRGLSRCKPRSKGSQVPGPGLSHNGRKRIRNWAENRHGQLGLVGACVMCIPSLTFIITRKEAAMIPMYG